MGCTVGATMTGMAGRTTIGIMAPTTTELRRMAIELNATIGASIAAHDPIWIPVGFGRRVRSLIGSKVG